MSNRIKAKDNCPACDAPSNGLSEMSGEPSEREPQPGDFSVCDTCGTICVFTETGGRRVANRKDMVDLGPDLGMKLVLAAVAIRMNKPHPDDKAYVANLDAMLAKRNAWLAAHPGAEIQVLFNYPPETCIICPISFAVAKKLVVCNGPGLELVKALGSWDAQDEPSVLMVRVVLEHEQEA